jgi:hypothetical protein
MKRSNSWRSGFAALALLSLMSWSVQAESDKPQPDKPCKGKDCAKATSFKSASDKPQPDRPCKGKDCGKAIGPMNAPNAARVNKSVSATKQTAVTDGGLRSNKTLAPNKLLPAVEPAAARGVSNSALKNSAAAKSAATPKGDDGKIISPMFEKK